MSQKRTKRSANILQEDKFCIYSFAFILKIHFNVVIMQCAYIVLFSIWLPDKRFQT